MLQLVLGRSGTGKSRRLLDSAAQSARDGKQVLLLVPEQFSFETERKMLAMLDGRLALNLSVLSFSRLAENVFRCYGGLAGKRLTDMARLVLMKLAVQECADRLELYGRQSRRTDFLNTMLQTVDELKSSGTYPEKLRQTIVTLQNSQLKAKLTDVAAVYEVYQSIVEKNYQDPLDDIARAVKLLRGSGFFEGYDVYVDGFGFFSPPERELVELILEQADSLTVALCAGGLGEGAELDIFSDQKSAAHRLIESCAKLGKPCKKPVVLEGNRRASARALCTVEQFAALGEAEPTTDCEGVRLVRAADKYEEARYAAAEITRLVRDCGYRYRDAAVVCRNLADYETALETVFHAYNIPLFFDKKEKVKSRPIVALTSAAMDAVRGGWKTEAVLRIARSPAIGVSMEDAAALENYVYIWSINGSTWEHAFTGSPSGLEHSARDGEELAKLESLRKQLIIPLQELREALKGCTGSGFALGLYNYLCAVGAVNNLREYYTQSNDEAGLEESDNLYNILIDILDLFSDSMGDTGFSVGAFVEMFELALDCVELGAIPNTNDQTIAGSADRVRLDSPRAVFALGVNEGVFPARYQPYGVFSDSERELLVQHGVELSASRFQRALLERFYLYGTLASPSERLYVLHSSATLGGAQQERSLIVSQLAALLPGAVCTASELDSGELVADLFTAREQYVRLCGAGAPVAALRQALAAEGDTGFLELMDRISLDRPAEGIRTATAAALINGRLNLSPSRIEDFYRCPYLYFCNSMLHLRPRRRVEYTPLESGLAIHYVLEHLLAELGGRGLTELTEKQLEDKISSLLKQFIESVVEDTSALANRFKYQFSRLVSVLLLLVRHIGEDFAQSLFTPAGVEVTVGNGGSVKPIAITVADGTELLVNGKIDRVDIYVDDGDRYARVVDYKSGGKDFKLEEAFYGLNMQMLLYLFALCDDKGSQFGEVRPAGVLYMPGKVKPADLPPGADSALLRSLIDDTLQMKGLMLEDEKVLRAMERELAGRYIPAQLTKSGSLTAGSKVKSAQEFARIRQAVMGNVERMGDALTTGHVEPLPARSSRINPCDYCEYGILCANKNTPLFRNITKAPPEEETS